MADVACVGHIRSLGHIGIDKTERMAANIHIAEGCCDLRHMAFDALASSTPGRVVSVSLESRVMRSVGRTWTVAIQAQHIRRLAQERIVVGPVRIMARKA